MIDDELETDYPEAAEQELMNQWWQQQNADESWINEQENERWT